MKSLSRINEIFFLIVLAAVLYFCYLIFEPFVTVIFVAGALSVTLYTPYRKLLQRFKGRKNLAAGLMCLFILLGLVIPISVFLFFLSKNTLEVYSSISFNFNGNVTQDINQWVSNTFNNFDLETAIKQNFSTIAASFNSWVVASLSSFLKGSTRLIMNLLIMLMTVFFLFRDGKKLLERVIRLTPLPDKYDREIFNKFREVSYSAIVSTLVTGAVQGIVAGIAFYIVGVPVLLLSFATLFASFIPFVGVGLVMVPVFLYLLAIGAYWEAIFIGLWALIVVSMIDNLLRPMLMKGKTQVHPMILFFAIFGGIILFGFWGVIFGPLIISITLTLLHIYEVEYCDLLGACEVPTKKTRATSKRKGRGGTKV